MENSWSSPISKGESHVVDQAVCSTYAVEEQVGLTTFPQLCIEEHANFVERWRCRLNIGEKLLLWLLQGQTAP